MSPTIYDSTSDNVGYSNNVFNFAYCESSIDSRTVAKESNSKPIPGVKLVDFYD